jgi:regulator of RNase E activity RraA
MSKPESANTTAIIANLLKLDTCTVSDALERHGLGGWAPGITALFKPGKHIAGRVITVDLVDHDAGVAPRHLGTAAIEMAGPEDIIVVANHGRLHAPGWGGLLSVAAKFKGVAGVIVDGAARDIDESFRLDFAVYAKGAVSVTGRGRVSEKSFNEPVQISGVLVRPADFVVADSSGVVFLPQDKAADVVRTALEMAEREEKMVQLIRAGEPVSRVLDSKYERMIKGEAGQ